VFLQDWGERVLGPFTRVSNRTSLPCGSILQQHKDRKVLFECVDLSRHSQSLSKTDVKAGFEKHGWPWSGLGARQPHRPPVLLETSQQYFASSAY
jgi:hypothetical protein